MGGALVIGTSRFQLAITWLVYLGLALGVGVYAYLQVVFRMTSLGDELVRLVRTHPEVTAHVGEIEEVGIRWVGASRYDFMGSPRTAHAPLWIRDADGRLWRADLEVALSEHGAIWCRGVFRVPGRAPIEIRSSPARPDPCSR